MTPTLRLLQCEVDEGEEDSYLRLLYQNQYIKYVVIAAGVYDPDDMCFEPVITALLEPLLPEGTWNYASIVKSPTTGRPHLTEITQKQLPSVVSVWHSTIVDYLDITLGPHLTAGVYDAKCSKFDVPLVAKFALWEWEIDYFNHECAVYQSIEGHGIGPRFLGHIAEEGRVIGFLTELVTDQGRYARHATPADLDVCCQTLARLHNLGILHGDLNKHNFRITSNGATLIDFSESRHSEDKMAFDEETRSLKRQLCDPSRRGRPHSRSIHPSPWQYHLPAVTEGVVDLSDDAREPNDEHEGVASKNATEI